MQLGGGGLLRVAQLMRAASEVGPGVTADRMVAWMQNAAEFRKSSFVLAVQRFSSPPRIEDLDTLTNGSPGGAVGQNLPNKLASCP